MGMEVLHDCRRGRNKVEEKHILYGEKELEFKITGRASLA